MEFHQLVDRSIIDTTRSLLLFKPELVLSVTIFAMLIVRLFGSLGKLFVALITLAIPVAALYFGWPRLDQFLSTVPGFSDSPAIRNATMALLALLVAGIVVAATRGIGMWGRNASTIRARSTDVSVIAFLGSLCALLVLQPWQWLQADVIVSREEIFSGMLVHDAFSIFVRSILVFFTLLFVVFTRLSGIPDREDGPDFYCLIFGSVIGMCLMASANHLLIVFLAVEMASVPSYALAAMLKGRREASEAALKYSIYGAGVAGVMLYGISLLVGVLGSAHLPTMATLLSERMPELVADQPLVLMVLVLGVLMTMAGLAFKLSAVPFHFWCPDVFEGASAEVNGFLSVASKAAALALLVRVTVGLGAALPADSSSTTALKPVMEATHLVAKPEQIALQEGQPHAKDRQTGSVEAKSGPQEHDAATDGVAHASVGAVSSVVNADDPLAGMRRFFALTIALMAAVTCTFGNLAAYAQTNIKRLLAYSTIAHAGYMMLPISAALMLAKVDTPKAELAIAALAIYMAIYLFMNLGAFAIVAFLRNVYRTEKISDFAGLVRSSPGVVICFAIVLFSLVGIPPLAGFVGKFMVFARLYEAYDITGHGFLLLLLVVGGVNTAISLFYYLRVVKVMTIDEPSGECSSHSFSLASASGGFILLVTLPLLLLFVKWDELNAWTQLAAQQLF